VAFDSIDDRYVAGAPARADRETEA